MSESESLSEVVLRADSSCWPVLTWKDDSAVGELREVGSKSTSESESDEL